MGAAHGIPLFPTEEIPRILDTVLLHAETLEKTNETEREDVLSARLYKLLIKDKLFRSAPYIPVPEHQIFDDSGKEGHSGRIDINFICPPGVETYFAFEAKRLHVTFPSGWQSLVGEYVTGDQGMMCFVTGRYSGTQQAAAMLGYVFDGDIAKARRGIDNSVRKNAGLLKLSAPHGFHSSPILPGRPVDETCHQLVSRPFIIYHLLVSVA
ncbi:MAG: hypothetical protein R6W72_03620 [Desulfurivibrionaceae bacterium]